VASFAGISRRTVAVTMTCLALGPAPRALAQAQPQPPSWPERPVRLITPGAPGTSPDVAARLYAERLSARWGVPVLVENRPGADGTLAAEALAPIPLTLSRQPVRGRAPFKRTAREIRSPITVSQRYWR
jgi:tripartite-type tricarboxylate transporter receptor subunit TctC